MVPRQCEAVGIEQARLFQRKAGKLRLLAFFITAGIMAGRDIVWLTERTGHTSLAMLHRYERGVRHRRVRVVPRVHAGRQRRAVRRRRRNLVPALRRWPWR